VTTILDRLEASQRSWAAHILLRVFGLAMLGGCAAAVSWLYASVHRLAPHGPTVREFLAAAVAFAAWAVGWAFVAVGPGLFQRIHVPGRYRRILL
jgi:hypothetical protein